MGDPWVVTLGKKVPREEMTREHLRDRMKFGTRELLGYLRTIDSVEVWEGQ